MRTINSFLILFCLLILNIKVVSGQTYCIAEPVLESTRYINSVQLADINNTTGNPSDTNYNYYPASITSLKPGQNYNLTLTGSPSYLYMHYAAWIDYNHDGDFYDSNEKLGEFITTVASQTFNINFTVPDTAKINTTRLRVMAVYNVTNPNPCSNYSYGETEDYDVVITNFVNINTGISGSFSTVTSFNFDNDADMDLFAMDQYFNDTMAFCYSKVGTTYSLYNLIPGNIPLMYSPTYTFSDLNNDNYLDAIFTGRDRSTEEPITLYYRKSGATMSKITTKITPLKRGASACADFDNDGRNDIIITGQDISNHYYTYIYKNYIDSIKLIDSSLPGLAYSRIICADYDKDLDIDIFMYGSDKYGNRNSLLYRNDGNFEFTEINTGIDKISDTWAAWGDMNNDGYLDLVINSRDTIKIYNNLKNDQFSELTTNINGVGICFALGDYDNDGLTDIISQKNNITTIWLNSGSNIFNNYLQGYVKGSGAYVKGLEIGDYNQDNKLDALVYGDNLTIMENQTSKVNNSPSVPTSLVSTVHYPNFYSVTLSWNPSSDDHTYSRSLFYNIKVGTSPGGSNILSATTGSNNKLLQITNGNVYNNTSWVLNNLPLGTYYWQVQAVDNAYNTSAFSAQGSFTMTVPLTQASYQFDGVLDERFAGFDFDGDNDMDVIIKKDSVKLYEQLSVGSFTGRNIGYNIQILNLADINNDNLPEIIYSKQDTLGYYIKKTDKSFEKRFIDLLSPYSLTAADFDNDGDVDLITVKDKIYLYECTKINPLTYIKKIISAPDTFNMYTYLTSNDIDVDGDIDLLISGPTGTSMNKINKTYTFLNQGNLVFEKYQDIYPGLGPLYFATGAFTTYTASQSISFNNYNADAYPDLFITGRDEFGNNNSLILLNDSTGKFNLSETDIRPTNKSIASWIDFNVDGYVDAILPVMASDDCVINLNYKNQYYYPYSTAIDTVYKGWFLSHINIDKDKDEDLLISKAVQVPGPLGVFRFYTKVYINNGNLVNSAPSPPKRISHVMDTLSVILTWPKGYDRQQDKNGLTYNIWLGTSKSTPNIITPMADIKTGYNFFTKPGNVGGNNRWSINNLPKGKYYWSVQAVDNTFQGGLWAPVDSFSVASAIPDFSYTSVCYGDSTTFKDLSIPASANIIIKGWKWICNKLTISTLQNLKYKFKDPGTYSVTLWVYTSENDSFQVTKQVPVNAVPIASFSVLPKCIGGISEFVNKSDTSKIDVSLWIWNFGNGEFSNHQGNVTQTYIKTDTAILTIEATNGCSDADTQKVYIGSYPDISLYKQQTDKSVLCAGDSSRIFIDPYIPGYKYIWLHDTVPIYNPNLSYMYARYAGKYIVKAIEPYAGCTNNSNILSFSSPAKPVVYTNDGPNVYYLVCSNTNADIYRWYYNGELIPQAQKYYYLAGNRLGIYYVEIQDIGSDCAMRSVEVTIPKETSGELKSTGDIAIVYPNPNNGSFKITFTEPDVYIRKIELVKLTGETVYSSKIEQVLGEYTVQFTKPNPGIYLLKVGLEKQDVLKMVVIQ